MSRWVSKRSLTVVVDVFVKTKTTNWILEGGIQLDSLTCVFMLTERDMWSVNAPMSNPLSRNNHLTTGICTDYVFVSDSDQNWWLVGRPECDFPHGMEKSVTNDSMGLGQCVTIWKFSEDKSSSYIVQQVLVFTQCFTEHWNTIQYSSYGKCHDIQQLCRGLCSDPKPLW